MPPKPRTNQIKFVILSADEARGEKPEGTLSALRKASQVYVQKLWLTEDQRARIGDLYKADTPGFHVVSQEYDPLSPEQQLTAAAFLASQGLDIDARASIDNRWSSRWVSVTGKGGKETKRELFQCDCGYDHTARKSKIRRNPVDFTGCLAHAEVLSSVASGAVHLIRGYFDHNNACKNAFITRIPPLPLHNSVFAVALKQLNLGANLTDIQATNRKLFEACAYSGQPPDLRDSHNRWLLRKSDTRSLYRQFNRLRGIRTAVQPQVNVHQWLDPKSPSYNKTFASAVFHYSARAEKGDRFEVCVATREMRDAAAKYGHDSQIILDGTFGVCDRKVLLFIIMAIDEEYRGVPLAFFLFSAPSGNAQTSSGYNTEILTKLLHAWKEDMEHHQGCPFTPRVAITDTDLKERGALANIFPDIWLLICKFHLRQSWRNHRTRTVKGSSELHKQVRARLKQVELALVESTEHAAARQTITVERAVIAAEVQPVDADIAGSAIEHLDYLEHYWLQESLWRGWSLYGRLEAAKRLECEVNGVLPTTNHLESFNGILKRKHLRRFQRGGRRLRIDVLLHLLVTNILPSIFEARRLEQAEDLRWQTKLSSLPGGAGLVQQQKVRRRGPLAAAEPRYAVLTADSGRDAAATELIEARQISVPTFDDQTRTFEFECFSSLAMDADIAPLQYALSIGMDGSAGCSCPDFQSRGIACKHLRAALVQLDTLRSQGICIPSISLPTTHKEARTRFHAHRPIVSMPLAAQLNPLTAPDDTMDGGDAAPTTGRRTNLLPTDSEGLPSSILSTRHTAQVVDDIIRESGDIFVLPGDRRFAGGRDKALIMTTDGSSDSDEDSESDADSSDEDQDGNENEPGAPPLNVSSKRAPQEAKAAPATAVAREGVVRQAVARVLHELEGISPTLQQMRENLRGTYLEISEVDRTRTAKGHLDALSSQLSRMLLDAAGDSHTVLSSPSHLPSSPSTPHSTPFPLPSSSPSICDALTPTPQSRKRSATTLLPPSPEKLQRRQDSYSIH